MPTVANTQDIGSETVPWRYVYAQSLSGDGANITNLNMDNAEDGTLAVARGGTGTSSFTANSVVISGATTTAALTTRSIKNMTTKGNLGWTANATDNTIVTTNTMAYWDGRYNSSSSNLAYCNQGAFGTMATKSANDYILKSVLSGTYDIMYSSAANTPTRLAANTTTTKKFLSMTGTGSAGAAPTWDTLIATDIPNLDWNKITSGKPTTIAGYGITDAKIASGVITLGSNTITPVTSVNGHTGNSVTVTVADLGLSNAMHFIGKATTTITDGGSEDPGITNYSPVPGDVVISSNDHREYVWSTAGQWEMLGFDASEQFSETTTGNTFISSITQNTDGTVSANSRTLDTSGDWTGNAGSATKLKTAQNLAVALGSTTAVTFDGTANCISIPVSGVLGIAYGGTGAESFVSNSLIVSGGNDSTKLTTLDRGTEGHYLISGGINAAPHWTAPVSNVEIVRL